MCAHEKREIGLGESMICCGEEVGQKRVRNTLLQETGLEMNCMKTRYIRKPNAWFRKRKEI